MHASLARIGRACTVEDEEPPSTPTNSSVDSQPRTTVPRFHQIPSGSRPLSELVKSFCVLFRPIRILPLIGTADIRTTPLTIHQGYRKNERDYATNIEQDTGLTTTFQCYKLTAVAQLQDLFSLITTAVELDASATWFSELLNNLLPVALQSGFIAYREYDILERCLSFFKPHSMSPFSIVPLQASDCASESYSRFGSCWATNPLDFQSAFWDFTDSRTSQLEELRAICENIRQCLTHFRLASHESLATASHLKDISNVTSAFPTLSIEPSILISLVNAHNLVFSGLSALAHSDLTRFSHSELWEMMRGVEELDILSKLIRVEKQITCATSLRQYLAQELLHYDDVHNWSHFTHFALISSPLLAICPISIGYLFVIITLQRSLRLANSIYQQLPVLSVTGPSSKVSIPSSTVNRSGHTLVDAFREYLNKNYDRSAADYLRPEYEFVAGFLDVLSQSTNLLYQVEKLKLVCNAAAQTLSTKTEVDRCLHPPVINSSFSHHDSTSRAMSVEGKHGILITGTPHDANLKEMPLNRTGLGSIKWSKGFFNRHQDTLQRACTLDRYVATGSVLCPLNTTEVERGEEFTEVHAEKANDHNTNPVSASTVGVESAKKAVQWSDHREISTRHQVISRFLEMTWAYTESVLSTLILCPPAVFVASIQSQSLANSLQSTSNQGAQIPTLTGCMRMPSTQLTRLADHIRNMAKSDTFPSGFLPSLRRQALKLDEISHRRRCYTMMLHDLTGIQKTRIRYCALTECLSCTSVINTVHSDSKIITSVAAGPLECIIKATDLLPDFLASSTNVITPVPRMVAQMTELHQDLGSMLRLTIRCAHQLAGSDVTALHTVIEYLNTRLKLVGSSVSFECELPITPVPSLTLIHSLHEIGRRIMNISTRCFDLLVSHSDFLTLFYRDAIHSQLDHTACLSIEPCCERLLSTVRLVFSHRAQMTQLHAVLDMLKTALNCLWNSLQHVFLRGSPELHSERSEDMDPESIHRLVQYCNSRWSLSNGIRLTRLISDLRRMGHSIQCTEAKLSASSLAVLDCFLDVSCQLIHLSWDPAFINLSNVPIKAEQLRSFLAVVTHTDFHCDLFAAGTSSCSFHASCYVSFMEKLFDLFCQHWFSEVVQSRNQVSANASTIMLNHITSLKLLQDMMMNPRFGSPDAIISILCACSGFRALQSLDNSHSSPSPALYIGSTSRAAPARAVVETTVASKPCTSSVCSGDTLLALSASVRNSIATPFKHLIRFSTKSALSPNQDPSRLPAVCPHISAAKSPKSQQK